MNTVLVEAKGVPGRTALFPAVQSENEGVAKLFLVASPDPNCLCNTGLVALHTVVARVSVSIVLLLLSFGANVNA